jgi:hypothetical protein
MNKLLIIILVFIFNACATSKKEEQKLTQENSKYFYQDKNGKFISKISKGINAKDGGYFLKRTIEIEGKAKDSVLEQVIVISEPGNVKGINILRPKIAQYNVWFDGKKYSTDLKVNSSKKSVEVKIKNPDKEEIKEIKFPSTKVISCFYSQIPDCVRLSGFLDMASGKKKNKMPMYVIWEGYPFLNETFSEVPAELFSSAEVEFDGITKEGNQKISVSILGQSIFYEIDKTGSFKKMFWVAQGISMVESSLKKSIPVSDDLDE